VGRTRVPAAPTRPVGAHLTGARADVRDRGNIRAAPARERQPDGHRRGDRDRSSAERGLEASCRRRAASTGALPGRRSASAAGSRARPPRCPRRRRPGRGSARGASVDVAEASGDRRPGRETEQQRSDDRGASGGRCAERALDVRPTGLTRDCTSVIVVVPMAGATSVAVVAEPALMTPAGHSATL